MTFSGTLATEAQVLLAIGANASAAQILDTNTTIWLAYAESDIETQLGENVGVVANYGSLTAANKQWLAVVASHRAAFYAINQNQNSWQLATAQSKLNVCDGVWTGFISDLKERKADIIADIGL
jgi:hypothetical protein